VDVEVAHGIEPGHARHRAGAPAYDLDLRDSQTGRKLDSRNPDDQKRIAQFVEDNVAGGNVGVGAGRGTEYMGPSRFHVGGGTAAYWGAKGRGVNAPDWLRQAFERGMKRRMSPQQVAEENVRLRAQQAQQQPGAADSTHTVKTTRVSPGGEVLAGPAPTGGTPTIGTPILPSGAFASGEDRHETEWQMRGGDFGARARRARGIFGAASDDRHGEAEDAKEARRDAAISHMRGWRGQAQPTIDRGAIDKSIAGQHGGSIGSAEVRVKFDNVPKNVKTHARGDGVFKDVRLERTPSMNTTGSQATDTANYAAEE
jgi:hypothetical protein